PLRCRPTQSASRPPMTAVWNGASGTMTTRKRIAPIDIIPSASDFQISEGMVPPTDGPRAAGAPGAPCHEAATGANSSLRSGQERVRGHFVADGRDGAVAGVDHGVGGELEQFAADAGQQQHGVAAREVATADAAAE